MMNLKRRTFLKGLGILGAAPAIVKAENIMKIWTPPRDIIMPDALYIPPKVEGITAGYYTLSYMMKESNTSAWVNHQEIIYMDGKSNNVTINFPRIFPNGPPEIRVAGCQLMRAA